MKMVSWIVSRLKEPSTYAGVASLALALGLTDGLDAPARPRWPLDQAAASANPTHVPGRKGAKA